MHCTTVKVQWVFNPSALVYCCDYFKHSGWLVLVLNQYKTIGGVMIYFCQQVLGQNPQDNLNNGQKKKKMNDHFNIINFILP